VLGAEEVLRDTPAATRRRRGPDGARAPNESPVAVELSLFRRDRRRVDVDNLAKTVLDALIGQVLVDDAQVQRLVVDVHYNSGHPRTEIRVTPV
jgi:Holliday junction resolvase RusA-like endonuclease